MFLYSALIIGCVLFLYTLCRIILPMRIRWWWKAILCIPLAAGAFRFPLLYAVFGGHFFRPDCPFWIELLATWLFITLLMMLGLLFVSELVLLPVKLFTRRRPATRTKLRRSQLAAALLIGMTAAGWGMHQAFALPVVKEITLEIPDLRRPVRFALLSDLHADRFRQAEFFHEVVNRVNATQADAVLITGDFEDGHLYSLAPALAPLRHLQARWGVYAVHGNHDYFSGHKAWERYLSSLGIRFLNNEHVLPDGDNLVLAGVTDPIANRDGQAQPDAGKAVSGAPTGRPIILLAHQPKLIREAVQHGVALQLSGHTHGGQLPGLRSLVGLLNEGLVRGIYRRGNTQVYVSSGTALWSGFPLRLFTEAEITLLTLVPTSPGTVGN